MFDIIRKKIKWGRFEYTFETGMLARQAQAAVMVSCGKTSVLSTLTVKGNPILGMGYAPLAVHYQERFLAAGKIPGGFFKREGRPSEKEVLTSRLIDRPLRAILGKGFLHETQIICNVLSYDSEHDADILAMLASMAAVNLAKLPVSEKIAGCRVAKIAGKLVLNPTISELKESTANVTLAGNLDKIVMIEGDSHEFSEKEMLDLLSFGAKSMSPMIDLLQEFRDLNNKDRIDFVTDLDANTKQEISNLLSSCQAKEKIINCQKKHNIGLCKKEFHLLKHQVLEAHKANGSKLTEDVMLSALQNLYNTQARDLVLRTKKRLDDRDPTTIRDIDCRVNLLSTPHGSALFTRGKTQALCTVTLGTKDDEQIVDSLAEEYREYFMLHYNFPPFATGEVNMRLGSPNRREIGHGKLAWRSFYRLLPQKDSFPYTVRVVSDILESNGSSSMATVCGTSMAMWDAGIPLSKQVAGIAMGAIINKDKITILSDISGEEDGYGDIDFKIAGTQDGITAIQLDVKCEGIALAWVTDILQQAHTSRMFILDKMKEAIEKPNAELKENVLRVHMLKIDKEQIAEIIGGGGKTIRGICSASNTKVDIEEDGSVKIYGSNNNDTNKAVEMINEITIRPEIGKLYDSQIARILPFGAVLNIGKHEAWLHISEIADKRIDRIDEVLQPNQMLEVRVLSIDDKGKARVTARVNESRPTHNASEQSNKRFDRTNNHGSSAGKFQNKRRSSSNRFGDSDQEGYRRRSSSNRFGDSDQEGYKRRSSNNRFGRSSNNRFGDSDQEGYKGRSSSNRFGDSDQEGYKGRSKSTNYKKTKNRY